VKLIKCSFCFTVVSFFIAVAAQAQPFKAGTPLCEIDWKTRGNTRPAAVFGYEFELKARENLAEAGNVKAQYQLGFVRRTYDGKWSAPNGDYSYNIKWLQKAVDAGHKSAAARLAEIGYKLVKPPTVDLDTYLAALINAAEAGNPWEASELMDYTREFYPCADQGRAVGYCLKPDKPHPLIKKTDLSKWAEIAGLGGNPAAQEWMCHAAFNGSAEYGQAKDMKTADRWCLVAAHNSCAFEKGKLLDKFPLSKSREDTDRFAH
jgi:TPR repeat protein